MGDLNSRMQKDRDKVDILLKGTEHSTDELWIYDDVVKHDELKKAIDAGWYNRIAFKIYL